MHSLVPSPSMPAIQLKYFRLKDPETEVSIYKVTLILTNQKERSDSRPLHERGFTVLPSTKSEKKLCAHYLTCLKDVHASFTDPVVRGEVILHVVGPIFKEFHAKSMTLELGKHTYSIFKDCDEALKITQLTKDAIASGGCGAIYLTTNLSNPMEDIVYKVLSKTHTKGSAQNIPKIEGEPIISDICDEVSKLERFGGHRGIQDKPIFIVAKKDQVTGFAMVKIACNLDEAINSKEKAMGFWNRDDNRDPLLLQDLIDQLLTGLEYLQSHSLKHGDIKAENIFLKLDTEGKWALQIGDFGASCYYDELFRNKDGTCKYKSYAEGITTFTMAGLSPGHLEDLKRVWDQAMEKERVLIGSGEEDLRKCFHILQQMDLFNLGRSIFKLITGVEISGLNKESTAPAELRRILREKECPREFEELLLGMMICSDYKKQLTVEQALLQNRSITFPAGATDVAGPSRLAGNTE